MSDAFIGYYTDKQNNLQHQVRITGIAAFHSLFVGTNIEKILTFSFIKKKTLISLSCREVRAHERRVQVNSRIYG